MAQPDLVRNSAKTGVKDFFLAQATTMISCWLELSGRKDLTAGSAVQNELCGIAVFPWTEPGQPR
jgi:hypothetical protein